MDYMLLSYLIVLYGVRIVLSEIVPNICRNATIEAALSSPHEHILYLFQGDYFWAMSSRSPTLYKHPKKISRKWRGLKGPLDAALAVRRGGLIRMYFFYGDMYSRYTITNHWGPQRDYFLPDEDYPMKRVKKENFRGIPETVDAAFVWNGNGRGYFFKDQLYWAYNWTYSKIEKRMKYPKNIRAWGLPDNMGIDAVVTYIEGRYTYFFKGDEHWKFDNKKFKMIQSLNNPFPRKTASAFFGCPAKFAKIVIPAS